MDIEYNLSKTLLPLYEYHEIYDELVQRALNSLDARGLIDEEAGTLQLPVDKPIFVFSSRIIRQGTIRRFVSLTTHENDGKPRILVCTEKEAKEILGDDWRPVNCVQLDAKVERRLSEASHFEDN